MKMCWCWSAALFACLPGLAAADSVATYHDSNLRHGAYKVPALTLTAAANVQRDQNTTIWLTPVFDDSRQHYRCDAKYGCPS